jgi:phosphohistidine phosphatase
MFLWLLRHAKSSWDDPELADHDRPLAPRGELSAARMRSYLEGHPIGPSLVLCSSARRARETLAGVLPSLGVDLEVRIEPALYTFDSAVLMERLRAVPPDRPTLLVGHNPAMQDLASTLATSGERLGDLTAKLPTGALVEIELPVDLPATLDSHDGVLTRFVVPRELGD